MAYKLDKGTIQWAEKRMEQLQRAEIEIGYALEHFSKVESGFKKGADLMDDQPESDMFRAEARSLGNTHILLSMSFKDMLADKKELELAVARYKAGESNDS